MTEKKRYEIPSKEKVRYLRQYKNMTDEEFDEAWAKKVADVEPSVQLEKRIDLKLKEFELDYDLDDLKINDKLILRQLIQAMINLEDLEQSIFKIRELGYSAENIALLREMSNMSSTLRKDISSMQEDLRITRKSRKGDKEQTVITYLEDLKIKAKKFLEARMFYIFCPKCNLLLSTAWFLYPESKNRMTLTCGHVYPDGTKCGERLEITSKELYDMRGTNREDIPEVLK